jgi:hypothetical protein
MKKCPKCGSSYTDDNLNFCLTDGARLLPELAGEKTELLSNFSTSEIVKGETHKEFPSLPTLPGINPMKPNKTGVSPIWLYSTIGLMAIIALSVLGFFLLNKREETTHPTENSNIVKKSESPISATPQTTKSLPVTNLPTPTEVLYKVVGVAGNDVLYIRPSPGDLTSFVGKLPPNASGFKVTGKAVKSGNSFWLPINYEGTKGWVNSKFIAKQ